ncbi:hypothetical protein M433DRAFT_140093 [Acidomyces richmondensis BFW]|nr:MAG: hypothetical protein FE78DRAFT_82546 [Acidomyces sp. 'richmondensis']KYG49416.1 hypothetical protein M433DRAFT_140093 [Acidomyces richmondensis BFW]
MDTPLITVDLLLHVLHRTLFHPFIACLIPLCYRAIGAPTNSLPFRATAAYAAFIALCWVISALNQHLAFGPPRSVDWEHELVVITGGAAGLGRVLAQTFGMRGANVAILDIKSPPKGEGEEEGWEDVKFYECDVSDPAAVERARDKIISDGYTLLRAPLNYVTTSLHTNLHASFHTLRAFLPSLLSSPVGGHIITISSVLAKLGASHLSEYTAAKAGLLALHNSLRAELTSATAPPGAENIRMILVTPGQLDGTDMFSNVRPPRPFWGPKVSVVELAAEIVRMVDAGRGGEISMPVYARWIECLGILPASVQSGIRRWSGVDRAMEEAIDESKM